MNIKCLCLTILLFCHVRLDHHQFQYEFSKKYLKRNEKDYFTFEGINFFMGDFTPVLLYKTKRSDKLM